MSTSDGAQISTSDAPAPAGAYSQGRRIGPFLQVSGQLGLGEGAVTVSQRPSWRFATSPRYSTPAAPPGPTS